MRDEQPCRDDRTSGDRVFLVYIFTHSISRLRHCVDGVAFKLWSFETFISFHIEMNEALPTFVVS